MLELSDNLWVNFNPDNIKRLEFCQKFIRVTYIGDKNPIVIKATEEQQKEIKKLVRQHGLNLHKKTTQPD